MKLENTNLFPLRRLSAWRGGWGGPCLDHLVPYGLSYWDGPCQPVVAFHPHYTSQLKVAGISIYLAIYIF
ncbi:uncharacterized protein VTP21DRAFT_8453 [Calcarisporiella thermophila]|uniref:uncharacterized protein n=1 Tax=Calcarisporiella thermophila TaxID=911321 RepID=UPI003744A5A9